MPVALLWNRETLDSTFKEVTQRNNAQDNGSGPMRLDVREATATLQETITKFITDLVVESNIPPATVKQKMPVSAVALSTPSATPTVVLALPAGPTQLGPKYMKDQMSETTEHVLIAAGSIGVTITLLFIGYVIYRWRIGKPVGDVFSNSYSGQPQRQGPDVTGARREEWSPTAPAWDKKILGEWKKCHPPKSPDQPIPLVSRPLTPPDPILTRHPLAHAWNPPGSSPKTSSPAMSLNKYLPLQPDIDARASIQEPPSARRSSLKASSPLIPDPRDKRLGPISPDETTDPSAMSTVLAGSQGQPPKQSRFSWTNSQAPQTPRDLSRFSVATSRSSVARYRTVDSWVDQQTGRVAHQQIQAFLAGEGRNGPPPEPVPDMPQQYRQTMLSEATVFRQHPGQEVEIPSSSRIPSEILDKQMARAKYPIATVKELPVPKQ